MLDAFMKEHLKKWIANKFDLDEVDAVYDRMIQFLINEEPEDADYFINLGWDRVLQETEKAEGTR